RFGADHSEIAATVKAVSRAVSLARGGLPVGSCGSALGGLETSGDLVPVHRAPPGGDVVRAAVLILEVVRVLPDVQAEDGGALLPRRDDVHQRVVLVGGRGDGELAVAYDQPGPAGAESGGAGLGERLLEGREAAQVRRDRGGKSAGGLAAATSLHELPE